MKRSFLFVLLALFVSIMMLPAGAGAADKEINGASDNAGASVDNVGFATNHTLNMDGDYNISGWVSIATIYTGSLTITGATTVTGSVGYYSGKPIGTINVQTGATAKFKEMVNARRINIEGSGSVEFFGDLVAHSLYYSGNGTVTFSDGPSLSMQTAVRSTETSADNQGYLVFAGRSSVSQNVGESTARLRQINLNGGSGKQVDFQGDVYVSTLNFAGAGTANFASGKSLNGVVTTSADQQGILSFAGAGTVTGQVGTSSAKLSQIQIRGTAGKVDFQGDVYANTLNYIANGSVLFSDGKKLTAAVETATTNYGALDFAGAGTVTGLVGTSDKVLNQVELKGSGKVDFLGSVYANTLYYSGNATAAFADGKTLTGTVKTTADLQGFLAFAGTSTVANKVGLENLRLKQIDANGTGKVTFSGDVNVQTLNFGANGEVQFAAGKTLVGGVTTATNGTGTLTFAGGSTVTGNVGTSSAGLSTINVDGATTVVYFANDVYTSALDFRASGTARFAKATTLAATVTTDTDSTGFLQFDNSTSVTGTVGTASARLAAIEVASANRVALSNNVYASTLNFGANGTVTVASGKTLDAAVTTGTTNEGTLRALGDFTTSRNIGVVGGNVLKNVRFDDGTVSIGHNIAATDVWVNGDTAVSYSASRAISGNLTQAGTSSLNIGGYSVTVSGTYTQPSGTTLTADISSSTAAGSLNAGAATIHQGGTLNLNVTGYVADNSVYTIVNDAAAGSTINLCSITDNSGLLTFSGRAAAAGLAVVAQRTAYANLSGVTGTAATVGTTLDSLRAGATGDLATMLNSLDAQTTVEATNKALQELSPEPLAGAIDSALAVGGAVNNVLVSHLAEVRKVAGLDGELGPIGPAGPGGEAADGGLGAWAQAFGTYGDQDTRDNKFGYDYDTYGVMIGADMKLDDMVLGASGGYGWTDVDTETVTAQTEIGSFNLGVYATYGVDDFYLNGDLRYGYHDIESERNVSFFSKTATGDTDAYSYSTLLGGGYYLGSGNWILTPNLAVKYTYFDLDGFTETGASGANLTYNDYDTDSFQSNVGVRTGYQNDQMTVDLRGNYIHEFVDDERKIKAGFASDTTGTVFTVEGMEPDDDFFIVGAGVRAYLEDGISCSLNYDVELREDFVAQTVLGEVRIDF